MWKKIPEELPPLCEEVLFYIPNFKTTVVGIMIKHYNKEGKKDYYSLEIVFAWANKDDQRETDNRVGPLRNASHWTELPNFMNTKKEDIEEEICRFEMMDME